MGVRGPWSPEASNNQQVDLSDLARAPCPSLPWFPSLPSRTTGAPHFPRPGPPTSQYCMGVDLTSAACCAFPGTPRDCCDRHPLVPLPPASHSTRSWCTLGHCLLPTGRPGVPPWPQDPAAHAQDPASRGTGPPPLPRPLALSSAGAPALGKWSGWKPHVSQGIFLLVPGSGGGREGQGTGMERAHWNTDWVSVGGGGTAAGTPLGRARRTRYSGSLGANHPRLHELSDMYDAGDRRAVRGPRNGALGWS